MADRDIEQVPALTMAAGDDQYGVVSAIVPGHFRAFLALILFAMPVPPGLLPSPQALVIAWSPGAV